MNIIIYPGLYINIKGPVNLSYTIVNIPSQAQEKSLTRTGIYLLNAIQAYIVGKAYVYAPFMSQDNQLWQ